MRYKLTAVETVAIKDTKGGLDTGTKLTVGGVVYADLKQDQWYRLELGGWVSNLRGYLLVSEVSDIPPVDPPPVEPPPDLFPLYFILEAPDGKRQRYDRSDI